MYDAGVILKNVPSRFGGRNIICLETGSGIVVLRKKATSKVDTDKMLKDLIGKEIRAIGIMNHKRNLFFMESWKII